MKRFFFLLFFIDSCKSPRDTNDQGAPYQNIFEQPVVQPLKLSKAKNISWKALKSVKVHPVFKKFNWDKLPQQRYDTSDFKPFKYTVVETKFDYTSLPENGFDIDKLPSRPLKFKTYILPPPKLIKGAKPMMKNGNLSLFGFGHGPAANQMV